MKLKLLLVLSMSLLAITEDSYSQIRHVRGIKALDAYYIKSQFGYGVGLGYVKYSSNTVYFRGAGFMEFGSDAGISYRSFGLDVAVAKTLLHGGHNLYFNGLGGCTFSVDSETGGGEQFNISSELKTGAFVGFETEVFLHDKIVLMFAWNQRILLGDAFGRYRWFGHGGLRFNL